MSAPIHFIRNYAQALAKDVDDALGFMGTVQTVVFAIGADTLGSDLKHAAENLAFAREHNLFVYVWAYPGAGDIASGKIQLGSPKMLTDAKAASDLLREHLAKGGKGGAVSILSELGDDWKTTPSKFKATFDAVAMLMPVEFVRVWALTSLKGLANAMAYRPDTAQAFAMHNYGVTSVDFSEQADGSLKANHTRTARLLALLEANAVSGLPFLGFDEAGIVDVDSIATTGKLPWFAYYKPSLALLEKYGGRLMFMASQDWKFGVWKDGRWAPSATAPGCPEACEVMRKKFAGGAVAKAVASPFAVAPALAGASS